MHNDWTKPAAMAIPKGGVFRTLAKVFYGIVRGLLFLAKNEILESS